MRSSESLLRRKIRFILSSIFFIAYAVGVYSFVAAKNTAAAVGFGATAAAIVPYALLQFLNPQTSSKQSVAAQRWAPLPFLFPLALGSLSGSVYYFVVALHGGEAYDIHSHFMAFMGWLMCTKWLVFTAYRLSKIRECILEKDEGLLSQEVQ